MAKVSVIIPVYNVEKYLRECLNSLINQTLEDIEIICVNDGATDSCPQILEEYAAKDSRIIVINQENQGLSAARNSGLKIAQGEYIGFVDSDDYVDNDYFEKLYTEAKKHNADIARAPYKYTFQDHEKINEHIENILTIHKKNNTYLGVNEHTVVVWNSIYLREFLEKNNIKYFDNIKHSEDISYTARTSFMANKIVPVIGTYLHYRQGIANSLSQISINNIFSQLKANFITTEFLNTVNNNAYKEAYKKCVWRCGHIFYKGLKDIEFTEKYQTEYLNSFVKILKKYKGSKWDLINMHLGNYFLLNNNIKAYIKLIKLKKLLSNFSLKKNKSINYSINLFLI